ncbi:hypothetical protein PV10_03594 [Exophiala mesophila]|uniref:NIMA interactive protein n=1 Tax=Exophiala mesophila TaxID=212818 RepID=A0A0D1X2S4_EXOME|nr:uncharacterized protein PV10_03594 [Exophiala mesophila]KIV96010.1 hypothetical protein PV10_03594 [Exophiala mesophila]
MESQSLERASQYLNNLLLARGLLSNGRSIDFARPDRDGQSTSATMSRIINLVHDLVLRRDQDAEQREFLASSVKNARLDENQRVLDLQRLQEKNSELARDAATAEAQQRTLKEVARKADAHAKELKEQMLKMKSTLDQVRAKCLSDVRKRDVELEKLKGHLTSMQRGKREASGMRINTLSLQSEHKSREKGRGQNVDSAEWSLEKETGDFLAALVNETSTENVQLRKIITDTMDLLRDLTNLDAGEDGSEEDQEDGIGIPGQYRKSRQRAARNSPDSSLVSCVDLAEQMSLILRHCQTILRDPSFVPIEEVQIRDEEIIKLRTGWEKMANRWKEAVTMMDAWRRRRTEHGLEESMDELSHLEFGKSIATLPSGEPIFAAEDELSQILYEQNGLDSVPEEAENDRSGQIVEDELQESDLEIPPEPPSKRRASVSRRSGVMGRPVRPLQPVSYNGQPAAPLTAPHDGLEEDDGVWPLHNELGDVENISPQEYHHREISNKTTKKNRANNSSGLHMERAGIAPSIPEKLAAIETEALEAQARLLEMPIGQKRKQARQGTKRAARRRSTLSPDELAELMGIE